MGVPALLPRVLLPAEPSSGADPEDHHLTHATPRPPEAAPASGCLVGTGASVQGNSEGSSELQEPQWDWLRDRGPAPLCLFLSALSTVLAPDTPRNLYTTQVP